MTIIGKAGNSENYGTSEVGGAASHGGESTDTGSSKKLIPSDTRPALQKLSKTPQEITDEDLLNFRKHIDQMTDLGIFNNEQATELKENMKAPASNRETAYLRATLIDLHILAYLAAEAKQQGKVFGPEQVAQFITIQEGANDSDKGQTVSTLKSTEIDRYIKASSSIEIDQSVLMHIGKLGKRILDQWTNKQDFSDQVLEGMKRRGLSAEVSTNSVDPGTPKQSELVSTTSRELLSPEKSITNTNTLTQSPSSTINHIIPNPQEKSGEYTFQEIHRKVSENLNPETIDHIQKLAEEQGSIKKNSDVSRYLTEFRGGKWTLINHDEPRHYKSGRAAIPSLYYKVDTETKGSFLIRLSAGKEWEGWEYGSRKLNFGPIIPLDNLMKFNSEDQGQNLDMSALKPITLNPSDASSDKEKKEIEKLSQVERDIMFELMKENIFAGLRGRTVNLEKLRDLKVFGEVQLTKDKYESPFLQLSDPSQDDISHIFRDNSKLGELNGNLYKDLITRHVSWTNLNSGHDADESVERIIGMTKDRDKVFLIAYPDWRSTNDENPESRVTPDSGFIYVLEDDDKKYLVDVRVKDNSDDEDYVRIVDLNKFERYDDREDVCEKFMSLCQAFRDQGLLPKMPTQLSTFAIIAGEDTEEAPSKNYIQITSELDRKIQEDAIRYSRTMQSR